ncbi:hypothetical protein BLX87_00690 [Bacillus sp. VT-16-64]|nr:hypothetical protein BLX87_00690 [Bacillus sp. VT-16-64]
MSKNSGIAIVGGGPGGLLLARMLYLKGVAFTVYERDESPVHRGQGGMLDLHIGSGEGKENVPRAVAAGTAAARNANPATLSDTFELIWQERDIGCNDGDNRTLLGIVHPVLAKMSADWDPEHGQPVA